MPLGARSRRALEEPTSRKPRGGEKGKEGGKERGKEGEKKEGREEGREGGVLCCDRRERERGEKGCNDTEEKVAL